MRIPTPVSLLIQVKRSSVLSYSLFIISLIFTPVVFSNSQAISLSADVHQAILAAQQKLNQKAYKQAEQQARDLLEKNPQLFEAQFIQAQALGLLGKTDAAIKIYQQILQTKTGQTRPAVYNNLAMLYARKGKLELARETLEKGLATDRQYKTLYENLSAVYVEMARGAYSKALKLGVQAKAVQLKGLNVQLATNILTATPALVKQAAAKKQDSKPQTRAATTVAMARPVSPAQQSGKTPVEAKQQQNTQLAAVQKTKLKTESHKKLVRSDKAATKKVNSVNKEEVITALQGWAAAWSAQAVDLYLSFYGKDFKPVNLSRKVWAVQRRIRLSKPRWVNVRLADFDVKAEANGQAIVQLTQDYRANNYRDKTRKLFRMKRTMDGWRILSEKNLAVLK